ncbi:MAG: Spy/CpxP family protein refolding chaperone [Pyrinomonadaceae bacterium]
MKKIIIGVLAAVVLTVGAVFVIGQKSFHRGHGRHGGMMGKALRGLDLTDEQKAKVEEIRKAARTNIDPLLQQMRENRKQLVVLGTDGNFDQAKVEALAAEQGNISAKLIVEKEKGKAQIFAILTDEQKAKAAEMRSKFEERFKDGKPKEKRKGAEF